MNEVLRKYPWNKSELEMIHNEIFQTTTEHKYYMLGVAQGFYHIYKMLNEFKDQSFTPLQLMEIIRSVSDNEKDIKINFDRLLKDIDED